MIDRVASLLGAFVGQRPLTLAQIARRSNLPRSSTHRILQRMVELGWIERHGFEYTLGMVMFELGSQVIRQKNVQAALPVMNELHGRTGLTVHLSALAGSEILHLESSGHWLKSHPRLLVGARQSAAVSAAGHALLAAMDPIDWPEIAFDHPPTCYSVRTRSQLDREVRKVVERDGVAIEAQGSVLGMTVVAATVEVDRGLLALSLSGPTRAVRTDYMVAALRGAIFDVSHVVAGMPRRRRRSMDISAVIIPALAASMAV
ncbi:IclR family transcriptional regulator [Rhodococcus sp. IEGM1428]|uniref:IclR family transcriptional regulator n=1 Tax=Rhodococcus sp. IEGM1428 TaxID=3392191 RepID=UPI003D0E77C7